ncbi:exosortase F system-associated membrane protein [Salegentibacter chungangensis]|uniref:Exosortase F system-associated protein n=1 Tax=Salegentibacter chungangensis TaxID=1335724 RepID=A0ABW3NMT8_9FLAO
MKARYRIAGIGVLVVILAMIRFFEDSLFYDPLIEFYKSGYLYNLVPEYELSPLLFNLIFRYALNSFISLLILYVAFLDRDIVKFGGILYSILFLVGIPVFAIMLLNLDSMSYMALFYVRRFLIHPVFIIILLPAFYYYRLRSYNLN